MKSSVAQRSIALKPTLRLWDAIALIVGMVIGAGIFETPALVAATVGSLPAVMFVWLLGGGISLIGALCYAELATTYPDPGGNYTYLKRAFGDRIAFLFSWARMTVIQPGSIALLAFVLGDYATQLWSLGAYSVAWYAIGGIALFTGLNLLGMRQSRGAQNLLAIAEVLGLLIVIVIGLSSTPEASTAPTQSAANPLGASLIFVLLSYGGWNEAAYISAELKHVERNMVRSLLWSIGIISTIYLLLNLAYVRGLGLSGMIQSKAIAADLMRQALGEPGGQLISVLVAIAALSSLNATILTGARTNYALGRDFSFFSRLGGWNSYSSTPTSALIAQGAIAIVLVILGSLQRQGFETMVDYTAPVFWLFFLLTSASLLFLRQRDPQRNRPFKVPFYPVLPVLFCLVCGYMLYSSLTYTGWGAIVGVIVLLAGLPVLLFAEKSRA
ncbi:amino acid permease [Merismopedia glauca CCAP 1448/3]|uniref:Amino acid permease n=2 Tax=Merismopedia TaxID=53402 RepID=A0A2T1C107_9CYAN|nr:amino acid permease [Merismopedia glauca CCAP 1448/3]